MRAMAMRDEPAAAPTEVEAALADTGSVRGRLRGWLDAAAVYGDRRLLIVFLLGFASGLPLLLTLSTLSIWLTEEGVSLTDIGLFAMVGMPYTLKFLWAPLVDRMPVP